MNSNNNIGYAGKGSIRELSKEIQEFSKEMTNESRLLEQYERKIDNIEENIETLYNDTINSINNVHRDIVDKVNNLRSFGEGKTNTTKYFENLDEIDISAVKSENLPILEEFLNKKDFIEEEVYKNDIIDSKNSNILTKGSVINCSFMENCRTDEFANIPYGFMEWENKLTENIDKVIRIKKNANTKTFEFGIKYTQNFSNIDENDITIERYFTGKIVITGILYNHDSKSLDPKDNIPFSIKAIIYNADYDNSGILGPNMHFSVEMDDDYIYLYLNKVTPYRLIPVIDMTDKPSLDMLDILEINYGKSFNKNYENLYIDDNKKLDIKDSYGVKFTVDFSLYDNSFAINDENSLKIIDFSEKNTNIDENKKGFIEVKPPVAGYTQLFGYNISESLNDTVVSAVNKTKEFRNYKMKTTSLDEVEFSDLEMSPVLHRKWPPRENTVYRAKPEVFRKMGIMTNDPDSDYFYMWVEEDLYYGYSIADSKLHSLQNKGYTNYRPVPSDMATPKFTKENMLIGYGKVDGKRAWLYGNRTDLSVLFAVFDYGTSSNSTDFFRRKAKRIPFPTNLGNYFSDFWSNKTHFYDEFTEYWYISIKRKNSLIDDYFRTKDFVNYEKIEVPIPDGKTRFAYGNDPHYGMGQMQTDSNGRFIHICYLTSREYLITIFDNGDFTSPYTQMFFKNNHEVENSHFVLYTDRRGNWIMAEYTKAFGDHSNYNDNLTRSTQIFSKNNGETWVRRCFRASHLDHHYSMDKDMTKLILCKHNISFMSFGGLFGDDRHYPHRMHGVYFDNQNTHFGPLELPQLMDKNGYHLSVFAIRGNGYMQEWEANNSHRMRVGSSLKNFNTGAGDCNNRWSLINSQWNTKDYWTHPVFHHDSINEIYMQANTKGGMGIYNHHAQHYFLKNRIYRVSKIDYSMKLVRNKYVEGDFTPSTTEFTADDNTWKTHHSSGSISEHAGCSDTLFSKSFPNTWVYNNVLGTNIYWFYDRKHKRTESYFGVNDWKGLDDNGNIVNMPTAKNDGSRTTYNKKYNAYTFCEGINVFVSTDNRATIRKIIAFNPSDAGTANWNPFEPRDNTWTYISIIHEDNLIVFTSKGIFKFDDISKYIDNNITTSNTYGYNSENLSIYPFPWYKEISDALTNSTEVDRMRYVDCIGFYPYMILDRDENKLILFVGNSGHRGSHKDALTMNHMNKKYDRKYWKGCLIIDLNDFSMNYINEAFSEPGDLNDVDFIDLNDAIGPAFTEWSEDDNKIDNFKTLLMGKDKKGKFIVSPKTGNIYDILPGWSGFKKRKTTLKATQVVYNNRRKSYILFNRNTCMDYYNDPFGAAKAIREIPLVTVDYNISDTEIEKFKDSIMKELDDYNKNIKGNVYFKLEMSIKLPEDYAERYITVYEMGAYNNLDGKNNSMISRYFVPTVNKGYQFTNDNGCYRPDVVEDWYADNRSNNHNYGNDYELWLRNNLLDKHYLNELGDYESLRQSQLISKPMEGLENNLFKLPTKVTLTIYPTSGSFTNIAYTIDRSFNDERPYKADIKSIN